MPQLLGCGQGGDLPPDGLQLYDPVLPGPELQAFALPAAGFLTPEALLERAARRRRARVGAALPDALDLLAVGTAAGRTPARVLGEISTGASGPLACELAVALLEQPESA